MARRLSSAAVLLSPLCALLLGCPGRTAGTPGDPAVEEPPAQVVEALPCDVHPSATPFALDAAYATSGFDLPAGAAPLTPFAAAVDTRSRLVVLVAAQPAGALGTGALLVRFTADGELDASFGDHGVVAAPGSDRVAPVLAVDAAGRLVYAGARATGEQFVRRLVGSGAADPSFGSAGDGTVSLGASLASAETLQQLAVAGRRIVVALGEGSEEGAQGGEVDVLSVGDDGALGAAFHFTAPGGLSAMGATPELTLLGAGTSVYAFHDDGSPVTTFGVAGVAPIAAPDSADDEPLFAVVPAPDGTVFALRAVASCSAGDAGAGRLVHLRADGTTDSAFGTRGAVDFTAYPQSFGLRCDGAGVVGGGWGLLDQAVQSILDPRGDGPTSWFAWGGEGQPITAAPDARTGATLLVRGTASPRRIELARLLP